MSAIDTAVTAGPNAELYGYIGVAVAVVFFGSNYAPAKKFPTGNGMMFQWIMCNGILVVGFIAMAVSGTWNFHWEGGSIWALGNVLVVPVINRIGLGLGILLWSAGNLIIPYFIGRFGAFGMPPEVVTKPIFSIFGVILGFCALLANLFIKPNVEETKNTLLVEDHDELTPINLTASLRVPEYETNSTFARVKAAILSDRVLGMLLALLAGTLYAFQLIPFKIWTLNEEAAGRTPGPFDFVISHYSGIYLMSTLMTMLYALIQCIRGQKVQVFAETTFPAFICGVMWAVACAGMLVSTANLGYSVGYPMVVIGPMVVAAGWSVFAFKEITGKRNLIVLAISLVLTIVGVVMFVLSKS